MTVSSLERAEDLRISRKRKFRSWLVVQAIAPYVIVMAVWGYAALSDVNYAFEKNFIGGDLVLAGALLLVGLIVEIWYEKSRNAVLGSKGELDLIHHLTLIWILIIVIFFAFLKYKSLVVEFPNRPNQPIGDAVFPCSLGCFIGGLFALAWSVGATVCAYRRFLEAELAELKAPIS